MDFINHEKAGGRVMKADTSILPDRLASDILANALKQGRITESEYVQITNGIAYTQSLAINALREANQCIEAYSDIANQMAEARNCAAQAVSWLNDPLVKPVFILSVWIEAGLDWLFRRKEAA